MQREVILGLILCVLIVGTVQAMVYPCSNDSTGGALSYSGAEKDGLILIRTVPTGASVTVDPGLSTTSTGASTFMLGGSPGLHSFTVSLSGYKDFNGQYNLCAQKTTYVDVTLSPATVTLAGTLRRANFVAIPTTTPTTTPSAAPQAGTTQEPVKETTIIPVGVVTTAMGTAATTGSLGLTTTPAGAFIFIDGVQRGVSPATIPALTAGDHTILLKLTGYEDLTSPVTIIADNTQQFSTGLVPLATATKAPPQETPAAKSPGFLVLSGIGAVAVALTLRKKQ